jgi:anti-sigma regulatory factor (Ser/Thr protein kinase)
VITETVAIRPKAVSWEFRLSPHPSSIGQARRYVGYALEPYAEAELVERIQLVVSELVTNAVRHGPNQMITLLVETRTDGSVSGEVVDKGHGAIAMREQQDLDSIGGLGLPIVDALASSWGVYPGSTHVWFRFDPA